MEPASDIDHAEHWLLPRRLERPISADNVFRSGPHRWLANRMWRPEGLFDAVVKTRFDPYAEDLALALSALLGRRVREDRSSLPQIYRFCPEGAEYNLTTLTKRVPAPPVLSIEAVLDILEKNLPTVDEVELLEFLTQAREDIPPPRWRMVIERSPWVAQALA